MNPQLNSIELKIIEQLKKIPVGKDCRILEVGIGRGGHTRLLRGTWENAYILGYELHKMKILNKPDWHSPAVDLVSEDRYEDITLLSHKEEESSFDIVTLGNYRMKVSSMFNFQDKEDYQKVIQAMSYYLKPGGNILLILCIEEFDNNAQKNYVDRRNFIYKYSEESSSDLQKNFTILDITKEILLKLGFSNFNVSRMLDDALIEENTNWTSDIMEYLSKNNIDDPGLVKEVEQINKNISEHGMQRGYFSIVTAQKT